jgi:hypothetical protein
MLLLEDLTHALDAATFAREALGLDLDSWQADVLTSPSKRLLMNVTRQGGKSTTAAAKALHRAVYSPGSLVLMVSPSLRQSTELYRKWRDLAHRMDVPPVMVQDTTTSATLSNGSRVVSLPSSESTIRGYSAVDLLLFDEASRVDDALYGACRPMVAVSDGAIVAMSTPWGKQGWFWQAWEQSGDRWERFEVAAQDCPRISAAFLEEERESLPPLFFESEYLCRFTETLDSVFRSDDIFAALDTTITPLFGATRVAEIHARA